MSSTPKGKSAAEEVVNDAEVSAILQHYPQLGSDPAAWLPDEHGDLDWSYTSRALRKMSDAELLRLITRRSVVSIPAREYNPSAPFVQVKTTPGYGSESGTGTGTVALPHGYRTPLCFVVKYVWESTLEALKDERRWKKDRVAIFHLWRLCESLLRRADVKGQWMGGMEKGWRCVVFDRLLTRFYKYSSRCDPPALKEFMEEYGEKEYDRDVQKHDWKRWCMRGLNGVQMSEDEVFNGITDAEFKRSLRPADDDTSRWYLEGKLIPFINDKEDPAYTSTSDLTDFDMDEDDVSDADAAKRNKQEHSDDSDEEEEEEEEEDNSSDSTVTRKLITMAKGVSKRPRPNGVDDQGRAVKRVRIENPPSNPNPPPPPPPNTSTNAEESHYRYIHNHIYPLTRTLEAMAKKKAANTNDASASASTPNGTVTGTAESASAGPSRLGGAASPQAQASTSASASASASAAGGAKLMSRPPRTFLPYGGSGFSSGGAGAGSGSVSAPVGRGRSTSTANGGGAASAKSNAQKNGQQQREEEEEDSDEVIVVSSRNLKNGAQRQSQTKPSESTPPINGQRKSSPPRTSNTPNLNPSANSGSTPHDLTSHNTPGNANSSQATSNPITVTTTNGTDPSASNNASASTSNQAAPSATTTTTNELTSTSTSTSISVSAPNPPPKPKLKTPTKRGGPMHAYDEHHSLFLASLHRSVPKPRQTRAAHSAGVATPNVYFTDRGPGGGSGDGGASGSGRAGSSERGSQHGAAGKGSGKGKEKDKEKGKEKEKAGGTGSAPHRVDLAKVQQKGSSSAKAGATGGGGVEGSSSAVNGGARSTSSSTATTTTAARGVNGAIPAGMDLDQQQQPISLASLKEEQDVINAKALELLVNLVDAKEVLRKQFLLEERASVDHPSTISDVAMDGIATTTTTPASAATASIPTPSQAQALSVEEQKVLKSKFHDFEGRFNSVKEELMGIVGRLQTLEMETREQRGKEEDERIKRVRELEERLRMKEEEERVERVERRRREEEERERERERRRVLEEEEKERKRKRREEEEVRERGQREGEERERLKRESMREAEVECRPDILDMAIQTEIEEVPVRESRGVQHEEVDVEMGEPTVFFAECAIQTDGLVHGDEREEREEGEVGEKTPKRLTRIPPGLVEVVDQGVQVQMEVEVPVGPGPLPVFHVDVSTPRERVEVEIQTEPPTEPEPAAQAEAGLPKDESSMPTPTTGTANTLMEMQMDGVITSSAGSDTDVDALTSPTTTTTATTATAVNGIPVPLTLTLKDAAAAAAEGAEEIFDPRAKVMTTNLSLLVDNLVSAKMMAVMDSMVKARTAAKIPSSTTTTSPDKQDQQDQPMSPTESNLSESHGSVLISTLLDELKAMKEETRVRAQREKEEMEAIRQLHSVEVDALRRRLSYLESQNRYFDGSAGVVKQRERDSRERSTSVHARDAMASSASAINGHTVHTPTRTRNHSLGPMDGVEPTPSVAGGENGAKTNPTPTPTPSERTYSFSRERGEDDIPLPIKSQRKHHISFPRPHFG